MKKILFISTRDPYSGRYSGDVIGSKKIIDILKKKNILDVVCLGEKNFSQKNVFKFKKPFFLLKIFYVFKSLVFFKPLQFGLFFSKDMKRFVSSRADDYDLIFFYHIRSSQYLPRNFRGKKIIEMGDLYSSNYLQTFDNLSLLNPLKYVYFLESLLVKKVERNIFTKFDKIILFSKDEIKKIDKLFVKKIIQMNISIDKIKKKYIFSSKNKKILFIGNLKYLPNRLAITNFIKNILPKLEKKIPDVSLEVIGDISKINKIFLSTHKKVKFLGLQKNIDKFIKGSFCGLANLNIATGIQGKILSYMSYGLPVICSLKVASNFNKNVLSYRNDSELINKIISLKNNKKLSTQMSNKSLRFINNFTLKKIAKNYLRIVKN
tara:strand:+ start:90 stop:1220 length:1131 start_codon:yes stop_codon:yes gene_type:complete